MQNSALKKYPRTPHLPWSSSVTDDDIYQLNLDHFIGQEIVVTEKMDGENTSMYHNDIHARSLDGRHHPSRDWVKSWHATIAHDIPENWRLCGENLYAQHSVIYQNLDSYFYLFSIWNQSNTCLSWEETKQWAELLNCPTPKELYTGIWDETLIRKLNVDTEKSEGYVVRLKQQFNYDNFAKSVAKWVRPKHVQTDQHWMHAPIIPNKLKSAQNG